MDGRSKAEADNDEDASIREKTRLRRDTRRTIGGRREIAR
jgi:hypothetical protein